MKSPMTTLCYLEQDGKYLMLHRIRKEVDVNKGKWIGVGGHFEAGESPEECLLREVKEETGLELLHYVFRGIVTFIAEGWETEYMCLYTADKFCGELSECDEGELAWIPKEEIQSLNLWEGDRIFLKLLAQEHPFFSLKLHYSGDKMTEAVLDGEPLELLDIRREDGSLTGEVRERSLVHENGDIHGTSHVWIVRRTKTGEYEVLMQKRSSTKDSFPGCYDISSAGHILAGSSYRTSALRELSEELGVYAEPDSLKFAFMHMGRVETEFYGKPFKNAEISAVYVYDEDVDISRMRLQREEVESVCWVNYEQALEEIEKENRQGTYEKYCIFEEEFRQLGEWMREHLI